MRRMAVQKQKGMSVVYCFEITFNRNVTTLAQARAAVNPIALTKFVPTKGNPRKGKITLAASNDTRATLQKRLDNMATTQIVTAVAC